MKEEVVNIVYNGFEYEPELSSNGGSYPQGTVHINFHDGSIMEIDDRSCGDFGTRITAVLKLPNGKEISAHYGSGIEPESVYTEFDVTDIEYLRKVCEKAGYHIPIKEEIL